MKRTTMFAAAIMVLSICFGVTQVNAATKTWNGGVNTDWTNASNWTGGLPGSGDLAAIPGTLTNYPTISTVVDIAGITINSAGTGATLTVTAGATVTSDVALTINSGGTLTQTGGTIHLATNLATTPSDNLVINSGGAVNQSGGSIAIKDLTIDAPAGTYTQSGTGVFKIAHDFKNSGTFTSTGGTCEIIGTGGGNSFNSPGTNQVYDFLIGSGIAADLESHPNTLLVRGNWTNNGSIALTGSATTVTFNGTSNQTITGATTFRNLTVNKSSGTLTLANDATIGTSGVLTLTSGVVNTGANKVVVNNTAPGAVVIASTAGSITGRIDRLTLAASTGTYKFTNTNTLIIPSAAQSAITMSVTSFPGTYPPFAPAGTAINRYYVLSPSAAFSAATLQLEYLASENINAITELSLVLFRRNAAISAWVNEGGIPVPASDYVTGGPVSTWSDWAVGDGTSPLPIQLSSFTGTLINNNNVRLNWTTISEVNNYGFHVQKRNLGVSQWTQIENSFVPGHGTTNLPQHYTFTDNSVVTVPTQYRLKQVDLDGTEHYTEPIRVDVLTAVTEVAPKQFALQQNYPNPFNPSTEIKFSVEATDRAKLEVYNALGQKIATLFDDVAEAGQYYRVKFFGDNLASGLYFYRLQSGQKSELRKLLLLK